MRVVNLILALMLISGFSCAQGTILEVPVTISYQNESLTEVLKKLEQKCSCVFSYGTAVINTQKKVSGLYTNTPLRFVLDGLFDQPMLYKQKGNYIIIKPLPTPPVSPSYYYIDGYVINGLTGEKISEASIYDPTLKVSAISSRYGYYQIKLPRDKEVMLMINKRNYRDTIIYLGSKENITINVIIYPKTVSNTDTFQITAGEDSTMANTTQPFVQFLINKEQRAHINNIRDTLHRTLQLSFLPFFGTNGLLSGNTVNDYSLNILGGYSLGVRKMEAAGLFNVNRGNAGKLQMAGLINANAGSMNGVQLAGNINVNRRSVRGVEVAGLMNVNIDSSSSVLIAGLVNVSIGKQRGVQIAGLSNHQYKPMKGIQLAGLYNIAFTRIEGTQVSGLLNVANKISGAQIGFINIADSCRGPQIGFLSIARKGYHTLELYADEIYYTNAAVRTGTRAFYNIFSVGIQPNTLTSLCWQYGYGVGTATRLSRSSWLNFDLSAHQMMMQSEANELNLINRFIISYEHRITQGLAVSIGPSASLYVSSSKSEVDNSAVQNRLPRSIYEPDVFSNVYSRFWIGWKASLRFF